MNKNNLHKKNPEIQESQKAFELYSKIDETKSGVGDILMPDAAKLNKLLSCGITLKRIDYVKKSISLLGDDLDKREFASSNEQKILSLFDFLSKCRKKKTSQSESIYSWFVEIEGMHFLYKAFGEHIDFESSIRKIYLDMLLNVNSYRFACELSTRFAEMDFSPEIKAGFSSYISKKHVSYLDISFLIFKDFSLSVDFKDELIANKDSVLGFFKRACKSQDTERIVEMSRLFGNHVDFKKLQKAYFVDMLGNSYNKAFEFRQNLAGYDIDKEIKEGFLKRFKKRDFRFAKQIRKDFGEGMDFSEKILEGIEFLKKSGFVFDESSLLKDFS